MLAAAGYYWSRGFGWIRSFRPMGGGRYVYAQAAAGHSAETVSMSFRVRDLVQLEGAVTKRDAETGRVVYESRFHRLLYLPPRAVAATARLRVEDGLLLLEIRAPAEPPKPPRSLGVFS